METNFPNSYLLLCKFHVLQSIWRHIHHAKSNVKNADRQTIFSLFKRALNCSTVETFNDGFELLLGDERLAGNQGLVKYFQKYQTRQSEWAMYAREGLMLRNKHTNNYSEASMKILKDQILHRTKAFT